MKTWVEIYDKYKDTERMEGLERYIIWDVGPPYPDGFHRQNIQGIWGHLMCFMAAEGILTAYLILFTNQLAKGKTVKQAMSWCTNEFFEGE